MFKIISFLLVFTFSFFTLPAQMWNGVDTLFGNEWINYDQSYFKVLVAEDGMYRLSKSALESAGVPTNSISGARFQLFHMGQEIPVYVSTELLFNSSDYIEFYGKKNRGDLDRFVYTNPDEEMLNPEYSLVSDSSAYFLTWTPVGTAVSRFDNVSNDLNNLPTAEPFYLERTLANFYNSNIKQANSDFVSESTFDEGEGFGNTFANSHEIALSTSNVFAGGGDATVAVRLATNFGPHEIAISFNNNLEESDTPNGFVLKEYSFNVTASSLAESNTLKIESTASDFDRTTVSNVWLTYPRSFNFNGENQYIFTVKGGSSARYLEIDNFNSEGQPPVLYDITNNIRIVTTVESGKVKIKLPASTADRTLVLSSQATGYNNVVATTTDFTDYRLSNAQFIIISNIKLFDDGNGANFVNEYAQYRATSQGGDYNAQVVDIQELYDQFAYGINRHFISIRNFGHYIKKEWDDPQYIFLIGKGRDFYQVRTNAQLNGDNAKTFTVPTFGSPGADNLLMGNNVSDTPIIPIGRIAVSSTTDIKNYLDKIQIMESGGGAQTIEDQLWKKQLLHLGGGGPNEQTSIKNHLIAMENIIENSKFGGEVTGVYKTSSDPIQIGESDAIFNRINDGVSVLTFFGHSAVGTFDFNIDNPARYENYGKYPVLFSLGCYSGNIHTSSEGISERFVFLKDKGAIAFGAATGQGYVSALATLAKEYYRLMGEEMYGESIGKIMQQTIRNFESNQSFSLVTLKQQFTIHGDPAYRVHPRPGPDYTVDVNSVSFDPINITATMDSFTINFSIANLGFATTDSINILLKQELPDGDVLTIVTDRIKTPKFQTPLSYTVASFKKAAAGQNKLYIEIDIDNEVQELPDPMAELNNKLVTSNGSEGLAFYIFDDSARPVFPEEFAIVNNADLTLKASTSNALIAARKYVIEIDTTEFFNSPFKTSTEITQGGGVIKWTPGIAMQDSTVYYWRVSPDSLNPQAPYVWENSSFVYLPNSSKGWSQSHYFQYLDDDFLGIEITEDREFSFGQNGIIIRLINKLWDPADPPGFIWDLGHVVSSIRPWPYFSEGVAVYVGDSINGTGLLNPPGGAYGSVNGGSTSRVFSFPTNTEAQRSVLIDFLENVVQPNNYVLVFTVLKNANNDFLPEEWAQDSVSTGTGVNIYNLLEAQGAQLVRNMEQTGSVPYTLFYKKDGGLISEDLAPTKNDVIDTEAFLPLNRESGNMISTTIGPAQSWESLHWKVSEIDNIADTSFIKVYGIDTNNSESLLVEKLFTKDTSLSFIEATQFPYLRLDFYAQDKVVRTAPSFDYWRVLYESLPDAAINANELFTFKSDTLQQGDQMQLELAIENISDYDMDSLLVKISVMDAANNELLQLRRYEPLGKDDIINTSFTIDTRNLSDIQQLVMEVNPNEDQPELYHFNNFALKQFFVEKDKRNPLMDVTFDGVHIMDGDIVSPKPQIYISLKDENQFLSLSDTSLFKLFLKYPGQQVAENIPIDSEWVDFFPDTEGDNNNKASIRLNPVFEADGIYELLVQAEDVTGNQSGDLDYKVTFEVITKSSISNVLNYPNPFSSSTQFVYTLTGEEIPEYFKIQILTVSGKIVKEITQDEIGPLKVGTHRTDYRWDGTDEYGDRLANGVYLYRVVAKKMGGEGYDAFDNGTSQMFKKGFGKLVIIR